MQIYFLELLFLEMSLKEREYPWFLGSVFAWVFLYLECTKSVVDG